MHYCPTSDLTGKSGVKCTTKTIVMVGSFITSPMFCFNIKIGFHDTKGSNSLPFKGFLLK